MTRRLLIVLVLLGSAPAYAEWLPVGSPAEKGPTSYRVYVDPDTLSRNGNLVQVWALMDFNTIQTEPAPPHLSVKSQRELDCAQERIRLLALTGFSGNMGSGNAVYSYSDSNDQGVQVEPGSVAQRLWSLVCREE